MEVLQGLVLLSVFSSYLIHADVIERWSYEEEQEEDRSSSYGALDCSGDTSGVVVPASCTTCYDVIGKRCLRNMEILQDACREGICVLMQGKYVLRTRRNDDINVGSDGQCVDRDASWCYMKHRLGYCDSDVNIRRYCPKACGGCDDAWTSNENAYPWSPQLQPYIRPGRYTPRPYVRRQRYTPRPYVRRQRYTPRPYGRRPSWTPRSYIQSDDCRDVYPDWCSNHQGQCQTDREMSQYCPCSCGVCTAGS